jgi:hypothetical protein
MVVPNPARTLDIIMAQMDVLPDAPESALRWESVSPSAHKYTDGRRDLKDDGPMAFPTTRAIAWAFDMGMNGRASWCAVRGKRTIGPAWMMAAGLSADRPGLAEARMVAEAMATGDVRPLVLKALHPDDCTDDMRLALNGMLELLLEPEDSEDNEPTELPDFNTEEALVARLSFSWCVVEADGFWILQHRQGDGDDWEWAGRFNRRWSLIHAVEYLVDEVDTEAMAILDGLPETPGIPAS